MGTAASGSIAAPAAALPQCGRGEPQWADSTPFALERLGIKDVWPITRGRGVVVAVVDSGVEADNLHLVDAVDPGISLIPGDPEPEGTDAVNYHGTAIASLIAARTVEGSRLTGVAPQARIMPVRVFASQDEQDIVAGNGLRTDRLAEGIRWAADNGADIINVSISAPGPDPTLAAAVQHAQANDALVVASVGNRGETTGDGPRWPAAYDGVLGVTATTTTDEVTDASVSSPAVDVSAPGQDVVSAWFDERDCINSPGDQAPQTSWAAGYVSGVAALVRAAHPNASAEEIAYRLMVTGDRPVRSQRDDTRGWGIVQPYLAITMLIDSEVAGPPAPGPSASSGPSPAPDRVDVQRAVDPFASVRPTAAWWALAGTFTLGMLTLLRVWAVRRAGSRT